MTKTRPRFQCQNAAENCDRGRADDRQLWPDCGRGLAIRMRPRFAVAELSTHRMHIWIEYIAKPLGSFAAKNLGRILCARPRPQCGHSRMSPPRPRPHFSAAF